MNFIHMADMHLDGPFESLAGKPNLAKERRLEQRKVMKEIVEYIKEKNIPYFFIAGDLYEQEYIRKSTIEYINKLFEEIPNTHIFITPGNHDPYIKNSFYKQFNWSKNVYIFSEELNIVEFNDIDIYGYGFNDFYMSNKYHNIEIKNKNKINILITHGSLDGGYDENKQYNPLTTKELQRMDFDYIALGHIHKASYNDYENQHIVYPGSTVSIGFDELGKRGVIEGNIDDVTKKLELKFIATSARTFEEKEIDITNINDEDGLIEELNNCPLDDNKFYKIILIGERNFDINLSNILSLTKPINIIKIKNQTKPRYNIEDIAKQISLKGIFARNILDKIKTANEEEKEKLINSFEIGMDVLK